MIPPGTSVPRFIDIVATPDAPICGAVWRVSPGLRMWTASGAMCRHDSNCDASCLVPLRLPWQIRFGLID